MRISGGIVVLVAACAACDDGGPGADASVAPIDAPEAVADGGDGVIDTGVPMIDAPLVMLDAGIDYNCGAFSEAPTWTLTPGFHAVVVADATDGLNQPVALTVASGPFGGLVYVVNQGNNTLTATDPLTGVTSVFVATAAWPIAPLLLTTIVWDAGHQFDGRLYVGDQGGDGDADSRIFRVDGAGTATTFTTAPGPGLDDIYGMAFATGGGYPSGLYVTGDTDGAGVDWGVFDAAATGTPFSEAAGGEGVAFDLAGTYGGGLFASRPAGGGYAGDDTISRIGTDGVPGTPLASTLPGVHAITFAPPGPFSGHLHAASWATQNLFAVDVDGVSTDLATGLSLTNYDGNILAFSPDGKVLFVADRLANRLVCIEPLPGE